MAEVSDSIHLRRFCRIALSERVPYESTVRKLTRRIGADTVNELTRVLITDRATVHVLRHTFATTLVRGGTDLVIVADLRGHARLETTRGYTLPSAEDRIRALDLLLVDK